MFKLATGRLGVSIVYITTSAHERPFKTIEVIEKMSQELKEMTGLPNKLNELGVKKEDFEKIAQTALNDGAMIVNPKKANKEDIIAILEESF